MVRLCFFCSCFPSRVPPFTIVFKKKKSLVPFMGQLNLIFSAFLFWVFLISYTHQLQSSQTQVLLQLSKYLEYPPETEAAPPAEPILAASDPPKPSEEQPLAPPPGEAAPPSEEPAPPPENSTPEAEKQAEVEPPPPQEAEQSNAESEPPALEQRAKC